MDGLLRKVNFSKKLNICSFLGILFIAFMASLPLFIRGIEGRFGQDLGFHLMRIEGLAAELEKGVFPVKMESLWMDGYGYPVSIYYGDAFLYIPAVLRILGVKVVTSYKIYVLLVNFFTALIGYVCFRGILKIKCGNAYIRMNDVSDESGRMTGEDRAINRIDLMALAMSAVYTTASYRYANVYIRAAVGEYTAMMFLPVVALAMYRIYCEEKGESLRIRFKNATLLALSFTGILASHMLTLEMVGLTLAVVAILYFKRTFSKEIFSTLVVAGIETVLLNLYFIVPFIDYYLNVDVNINAVVGNARQIQNSGAAILRLFRFYESPFQHGADSGSLLTTPGIILLIVLIASVILFILELLQKEKKYSYDFKVLTGIATVLTFMTTAHFPWNAFATCCKLGDLMAQVQFPWRYFSIIDILLSVMLGEILLKLDGEKLIKGFVAVILVLTAALSLLFAVQYNAGAEKVYYADREDLNTSDMGFIEYLRAGTVREDFDYERHVYEDGTVEEPILNYKGYQAIATTNQGEEMLLDITDGTNNVIKYTLPEGFEGEVEVVFKQPAYWIIAEIVSVMTFLLVLALCILYKKQPLTGECDQ